MRVYRSVFIKNLKRIRKQKKITQWQLAEKLGIDTTTLSRYEQGKFEPSLTRIMEICEVLEVKPNELLCSKEKYDHVWEGDCEQHF